MLTVLGENIIDLVPTAGGQTTDPTATGPTAGAQAPDPTATAGPTAGAQAPDPTATSTASPTAGTQAPDPTATSTASPTAGTQAPDPTATSTASPTASAPAVPTYGAYVGGSPANVAVAARRLGAETALIARVSRDVFGTRIRARLAADGVDDRYLVEAAEPSSLAVVTFDDQRRATYDFWLTGTADWQWSAEDLPSPLGDDVTCLHVGSLAAFLEPGASAIEALVRDERARGRVTISLDPNVRPAIVAGPDGDLGPARARVERLVALAHVVKASDEDLAHLYPGVSVEEAGNRWLASGPSLVVVTLGVEGALALTEAGAVTVKAPKVDVADTVGAGDTFSGALLHGLDAAGLLGGAPRLDADQLRAILTEAVAAAAINCTRDGANPPDARELAEFLTTQTGM